MGPALETFLTALFVCLAVIGAAAWLGMPIWRRLYQFFRRWYMADALAEEARREQAAGRQQAQREVDEYLHGAAPASEVSDPSSAARVVNEQPIEREKVE